MTGLILVEITGIKIRKKRLTRIRRNSFSVITIVWIFVWVLYYKILLYFPKNWKLETLTAVVCCLHIVSISRKIRLIMSTTLQLKLSPIVFFLVSFLIPYAASILSFSIQMNDENGWFSILFSIDKHLTERNE